MNNSLLEKLSKFSLNLSRTERENLKLLLGEAAGDLVVSPHKEKGCKAEALQTSLTCLSNLQPYADRIPPDGIVWRGRPPFLSEVLLKELQIESATRRKDAIKEGSYLLGCGGPIADKLAMDKKVTDFIESYAGPIVATGVASYLYYEEPGQGLDPHVDTSIFSINMILMLKHQHDEINPSKLVTYSAYTNPQHILLKPGESLILFADSIVHAREPVKEGEFITLLTFGFQPV
jgi:hypothetical protein